MKKALFIISMLTIGAIEALASVADVSNSISELRRFMGNSQISAVIIPSTDPHQGEYIPDYWQIRRYFSGFTGSAGTLVVTTDKALLWTDGRYFIQAASQIDGSEIQLMKDGLPETPDLVTYLCDNLPNGAKVGVDGWLFSSSSIKSMKAKMNEKGIELRTDFNPIDEIWTNRPSAPCGEVIVHDLKYAGQTASAKIAEILAGTKGQDADAILISALDEISWALNIRARDIDYDPVVTSYLYISPEKTTLFIKRERPLGKVKAHFDSINVEIAQYEDVEKWLQKLPANQKVLIDPSVTSNAIAQALGDRTLCGKSPAASLKARKSPQQLEGFNAAMIRDGVAMVKAIMEIEETLSSGKTLTEMDVSNIIIKKRAENPIYFDESFATIVGYGSNGAIIHYTATDETNAIIQPEGLLLIDCGAQYLDGTTDITRTFALSPPTAQQCRDFTYVMKGLINLTTAIFPEGVTGHQIDAFARLYMWREGLNYLHGTGHGVGHFLNCHEGPQSILPRHAAVPLAKDQITSIEPGLYREGLYGIRCENLVLTTPAMTTEFGKFLKFETITLFPFDLSLVDVTMLSDDEIKWINSYHEMVRERLIPHLNANEIKWLNSKTATLAR